MTIWIAKCDHGIREFDSLADAEKFRDKMLSEKLCYSVIIFKCKRID